MLRRAHWVLLLIFIAALIATSVSAQTVYWKKDHIYANGKEVAVLMPAPADQLAPSAPTSLAASLITATSVRLTWTGSSDTGGSLLAGYKVYRGSVPVATVTSTMLDEYNLSAGTTYTYTVAAFDNAQNISSLSSPVTFTTTSDTTPPSTPTNFAIGYAGTTQARLDWTASTDTGGSGLSGYNVFRLDYQGTSTQVATASPYNYFDDPNISADSAYSYYVVAIDRAGNTSGATPTLSLFHDDFNRSNSTGLSNASWNNSGTWNVSSNQASMSPNGGALNDAFGSKSFGSFTASLRFTSQPSTSAGGFVFWGDVNVERYYAILRDDGIFILVHFTGASSHDLNLTSASIGAAPATIRIQADSPSRTFKIFRNDVLFWTYTDTNTAHQNTGKVGIGGYVASSTGNLTIDDFAVTEGIAADTTAPSTPQNLSILYSSATAAQLNWSPSTDFGGSGVAGYRVYREGSLISGSTLISATSYQDTTLTADTPYSYTVTAVDLSGNESAPTNARSVFRDDFNRADSSGLNNAGWSNPTGVWNIASNVARSPYPTTTWTASLTTKSFGSFSASMNVTGYVFNANVGMTFWSSAAGQYRVAFNNTSLYLFYYSPTAGYTLASASPPGWYLSLPAALRVETDSAARTISIYVNNVLTISYQETDITRTNSGQVGPNAVTPSGTGYVQVDDFKIEER
jgi:fibronectin type 3 domain-containing protein